MPRAKRNPDVAVQFRKLVEGGDAKAVERAVLETRDFLRANRIYGVSGRGPDGRICAWNGAASLSLRAAEGIATAEMV